MLENKRFGKNDAAEHDKVGTIQGYIHSTDHNYRIDAYCNPFDMAGTAPDSLMT